MNNLYRTICNIFALLLAFNAAIYCKKITFNYDGEIANSVEVDFKTKADNTNYNKTNDDCYSLNKGQELKEVTGQTFLVFGESARIRFDIKDWPTLTSVTLQGTSFETKVFLYASKKLLATCTISDSWSRYGDDRSRYGDDRSRYGDDGSGGLSTTCSVSEGVTKTLTTNVYKITPA